MKKFVMGFILALVTLVSAFAEQNVYFDEDGHLYKIYDYKNEKQITRYSEDDDGDLCIDKFTVFSTDFEYLLFRATDDLKLAETYKNETDVGIIFNLITDAYDGGRFNMEGFDTDMTVRFACKPYDGFDGKVGEIYSLENMRCMIEGSNPNVLYIYLSMSDGFWINITISYFEEE